MNHTKHIVALIAIANLFAVGCKTSFSDNPDLSFPPTPESLGPEPSCSGSGFFVSTNGYFLTNHHVVEDAHEVWLETSTRRLVEAKVVKTDPINDLALLKVEGSFHPARFQPAPKVELGDRIFVMGFPDPSRLGREVKQTQGSVSGVNGIKDYVGWFQMDASINPGNSGGPVVNANGEVVGVAVATVKSELVIRESGYIPQNVNYAVKTAYAIAFLKSTECDGMFIQERGNANNMGEAIKQLRESTALVLVF